MKHVTNKCLLVALTCSLTIAHSAESQNKSCCENIPSRVRISNTTDMVLIPGGTFMMGGDNHQARNDELPKHKVTLTAFKLDKSPVTNAQFAEFIKRTKFITTAEKPVNWQELKQQLPPGTPEPSPEVLMPASLVFVKQQHPVPLHDSTLWWSWTHGANWQHPHGPNSNIDATADHPVVHVSWEDANAYCKYYGKRLPTEAEWEYAARGGFENKIYPWGDDPIDATKANFWQGEFPYQNDRNDNMYSTAVCSYPPNNYGLYDMAGNVWEWVSDWYDYQYYTSIKDGATNPQGPSKPNDPSEPLALKKVIRGGSFLCNESYCTGYRVAARMRTSTDTSMEHLGFRCAADITH